MKSEIINWNSLGPKIEETANLERFRPTVKAGKYMSPFRQVGHIVTSKSLYNNMPRFFFHQNYQDYHQDYHLKK